MKLTYERPILIVEEFVTGQYCSSDCGIQIQTPPHGHVNIKNNNEIHCAFTSSNCGPLATSCLEGITSLAHDKITTNHNIITKENRVVIQKPQSNAHNCHILSSHEAAEDFANYYSDENCKKGVAKLMGISDFNEISQAWS